MDHACKTDGAIYETEIEEHRVSCVVFLPPNIKATETAALKKRLHDAMEHALSPLWGATV